MACKVFRPLQMRLWHLPCQRTPLGYNLVSTVSIGARTRTQAHLVGTWPTISWHACNIVIVDATYLALSRHTKVSYAVGLFVPHAHRTH